MTSKLIDAARSIGPALPDDVVALAKVCLLDWIAVAMAGTREDSTRILREQVLSEGGTPRATLVGTGDRVSLRQAALVNGSASHVLDYDDTHLRMRGHPSVCILPALLALAEDRHASGADFIAAYVAGMEVTCRIGQVLMPDHFALKASPPEIAGYHTTSFGTFGAAVACAHLMKLPVEKWQYALGIAGTQAAGLKATLGTMCKSLNAGNAAASGLTATLLASRGFDGNPAIFEARYGYLSSQTTKADPHGADFAKNNDGSKNEYALRSILFKFHAACYGCHETIEGVMRLKARHGFAPSDVAKIALLVPTGNLRMCDFIAPKTHLEGKFSMRYTAALALIEGRATDAEFTDEMVKRQDLVEAQQLVTVTGVDHQYGTTVTITLRDGRSFEESLNLHIPQSDLDLQRERITTKFLGLTGAVVGRRRAEALLAEVEKLDQTPDVARILALFGPEPSPRSE